MPVRCRSESSGAVLDVMRAALDRVGGDNPDSLPFSDTACRAAFTLAQYADSMYRCVASSLPGDMTLLHALVWLFTFLVAPWGAWQGQHWQSCRVWRGVLSISPYPTLRRNIQEQRQSPEWQTREAVIKQKENQVGGQGTTASPHVACVTQDTMPAERGGAAPGMRL